VELVEVKSWRGPAKPTNHLVFVFISKSSKISTFFDLNIKIEENLKLKHFPTFLVDFAGKPKLFYIESVTRLI
jgi:hypothetical protein